MDLYGKLNKETIQKEYFGSTSETIKVTVNNQTNSISADLIQKRYLHNISFRFDTEDGFSSGLVLIKVLNKSNLSIDFQGLKNYLSNFLPDGVPYSSTGYILSVGDTNKVIYGVTLYNSNLAIQYVTTNDISIIDVLNVTEFTDTIVEI